MRAPSMISLLSVVLCVCCVFVPALGQPYTLYNSNFKDPYTDLGGALLDVNVKLCSNWNEDNDQLDFISVTIPTTPSSLAAANNGYFVGPAFTDLPIPGVAIRGDNVPHDVTLLVSWDGNSKLTFRGFHLSSWTVVQVPGRGDSSPYWVNVNFDVTPSTFVSPWDPSNPSQFITTIPAGKLPLAIVLYPAVASATPDAKPNINEVDLSLFDAEPPNGEKPAICNGGSSTQDPIFSGFQGQVFQFHGLPDEHFNLVSSPDVQLNSHFIYLSSGKCDYNDTECYTHPGTYMDVLGFSIADSHVKLVAGTHEQGLRVWVNDQELQRGARINALSTNTTAALQYHHNGRVTIQTEIMNFEMVNSDMFMNLHVSLNIVELLRVGSKHHTVTDHALCKTNFETHNHQLIESTVAKKYPVTTPLHGLIGQTWRNVKVCGRDWMGTVQDYLVSDLFASDNHYSYFKW